MLFIIQSFPFPHWLRRAYAMLGLGERRQQRVNKKTGNAKSECQRKRGARLWLFPGDQGEKPHKAQRRRTGVRTPVRDNINSEQKTLKWILNFSKPLWRSQQKDQEFPGAFWNSPAGNTTNELFLRGTAVGPLHNLLAWHANLCLEIPPWFMSLPPYLLPAAPVSILSLATNPACVTALTLTRWNRKGWGGGNEKTTTLKLAIM